MTRLKKSNWYKILKKNNAGKNSKNLISTKLKNRNCEKSKLQNKKIIITTQDMTTLKNKNCDKTQKLKVFTNSKT